jgi:hypothetical protein
MPAIVDSILSSPAAIAAIIAAVFSLVAGVLGPVVALWVGHRQTKAAKISADAAMLSAQSIGSREIASMRLAWMEKLRDTLAEFHATLMSLDDSDFSDDDRKKLALFGTQLDLLLNRNEEMQKKLWDVTDKIYRTESVSERQQFDEELIEAGRTVLKAEWEKVKAEMRGQPFQTS